MKSEPEILVKVRAILAAELERRLGVLQQRLPHQCSHNYRHPLDVRKQVEGARNPSYNRLALPVLNRDIGLCRLGSDNPEEWSGTICDEPADARSCPIFMPMYTRSDVLTEFRDNLSDPVWTEKHLPGYHSLVWVLDLETQPPQLTWWQRLFLWFRSTKLEPVQPAFDVEKALLELGAEQQKDN